MRGLLDAHGIEAAVASALSPSLFPMRFGQAEFRVSVPSGQSPRARASSSPPPRRGRRRGVRRLSETLGPLEERIGYEFRDLGLLEHALTHRSRAHEDASGGVIDNESLEFLGDAVLGFVIADLLFTRFPTHSEGYKSKVKAGIVSAASLARLAEEIDLGRFVLLGRGEEKTGGRQKHAILADSFEALIAAIYLDGGIEAAREFILSRFGPLVAAAGDRAAEASFTEDWKSALAGMAAGRRPRPAALPARGGRRPRSPQALRRRSRRRRRGGRPRDRPVEEGSRAAGREGGARRKCEGVD